MTVAEGLSLRQVTEDYRMPILGYKDDELSLAQIPCLAQIQHDFGIESAGGLELYIDVWRLPLCSSSAVLRDGDVLTVSRSTGAEPQLQVSPTQLLWLLPDVLKVQEE